jgi:hypothetical protein
MKKYRYPGNYINMPYMNTSRHNLIVVELVGINLSCRDFEIEKRILFLRYSYF